MPAMKSYEVIRQATDEPGVKVSWQVTAQRDDAYMRKHPFEAERDKH